jgi:short-subunit dehydrogenase
MNPLDGRTVLLTGASGGIGAALCDALVAAGARAVAARHGPGRIVTMIADLADAEGPTRLAAAAAQLQPTPSVLVLAHAQGAFGLFEQQSPQALQSLLNTNLVASMTLIHALLPMLRAHPQASVVAIGSTFGSLAFPGFAAYSASKFGLRGLMEGLAREHADTLRFQYLSPRATRTAFNTPQVEAMNREMKVAQDDPVDVAAQLVAAIASGRRRLQIGWPEKLFARINGVLPGLVDRNLAAQLPIVRRHARS